MIKNKVRPLILLAVFLFFAGFAKAQVSINTSGGDATGSGGTVAYSVGQVFFNTVSVDNGSVAEGVQHAYEITTVGIKETFLNITLVAFPNPTSNHLTLQINDYNNEIFWYQLFDMHGKQIIQGQISERQTQIKMSSLAKATYFINVVNEKNQKIKTFKIVKN